MRKLHVWRVRFSPMHSVVFLAETADLGGALKKCTELLPRGRTIKECRWTP